MGVDPIEQFKQGAGNLVEYTGQSSDSLETIDLAEVGKPCVYHESADPGHRISDFFRTRMSIIDLLPCRYRFRFTADDHTIDDAAGLFPEIQYGEAMAAYSARCGHHGLPPKEGIRIYTTDDTQAADQFTNQLKDNFFQSAINRMAETFEQPRKFLQSVDEQNIRGLVGELMEDANLTSRDGPVKGLVGVATDILAKGHRVSLPSIWSDSSYQPNFTTNVRLVSPYGSPDAIKEFVIKPLMYLLIISSPKTEDGISYGHPFFLTVKGYGMAFSPLAMISNITLRRGGNDTSFSIYRQPLSINVSMEFQYAVRGFAHHSENTNHPVDANVFATSTEPEYVRRHGTGEDTSLPTIGHIVRSLRPRVPHNVEGYSDMKEARNTKDDL